MKIQQHLARPFREHLADPDVTDIVVNKPGEIGVERAGIWHWIEEPWLTYDRLFAIAITAAYATSQNVSDAQPIVRTTMPDGQRLHVCCPPVTDRGIISLTIRNPARFQPSLDALATRGMFATDEAQERQQSPNPALAEMAGGLAGKLSAAVRNRKNVLISGATGSGKTTLARALIAEIPLYERLITVEDTFEWKSLPQRNRVALEYSKGGQSSASITGLDLIESSLRMRPDRVLIGELSGLEAFAYLRAVVAGHPGGITTLHADSALGAFDALRLMVRQHPAGATMSDGDVTDMLHQHVDVVAHCHHDKQQNTYRVTDLYERAA